MGAATLLGSCILASFPGRFFANIERQAKISPGVLLVKNRPGNEVSCIHDFSLMNSELSAVHDA